MKRDSSAADRRQLVTCKLCGKRFKAITYTHLAFRHGEDSAHPIDEYKRTFKLRWATSPATRKKKKLAQIARFKRLGRYWTRADVLVEIKRQNRKGRLTKKRSPAALYNAACRRFGNWRKAIAAAGLDYEAVTGIRQWNREKIIQALQRLAAEGALLSDRTAQRDHSALYSAAMKYFGVSWPSALRAAGVDPDAHREPRGKWTNEAAAAWMHQRIRRGQSLLAGDAPPDLVNFVRRRMGAKCWSDFVESFGVEYAGEKRRFDWTREKVLDEIRRWNSEGRPTNHTSVASNNGPLVAQARKFFGSWDAARKAAGVPVVRAKSGPPAWFTPEALLKAIRCWRDAGHLTNQRSVVREKPVLWTSAVRYFGTWRAACEAAGVEVNRLPKGPRPRRR